MRLRNPNTSLAVVTGASGHLGGNLVRGLLAAGQRVRAVDLRKTPALDGLNVEWCHTDLRDPGSVAAAFAGADVVYHLAAVISLGGDPPGRVWSTNVDAVATVAETALQCGVRRMVHCSSVHAFDIELCGQSAEGLHALRSAPTVVSRKAELELGHRARAAETTVGDLYRWFDQAGYS